MPLLLTVFSWPDEVCQKRSFDDMIRNWLFWLETAALQLALRWAKARRGSSNKEFTLDQRTEHNNKPKHRPIWKRSFCLTITYSQWYSYNVYVCWLSWFQTSLIPMYIFPLLKTCNPPYACAIVPVDSPVSVVSLPLSPSFQVSPNLTFFALIVLLNWPPSTTSRLPPYSTAYSQTTALSLIIYCSQPSIRGFSWTSHDSPAGPTTASSLVWVCMSSYCHLLFAMNYLPTRM